MIFKMQKLTSAQILRCHQTMSSNTFYMLVCDALVNKDSLNVVRMGDGEKLLMEECMKGTYDDLITWPAVKADPGEGEAWLKKLGVWGIRKGELKTRLMEAAQHCDYFAPSITGIQQELFNLYDNPYFKRPQGGDMYVDNFFVNAWDEEMKIALFKEAGHVLLIHCNAEPADAMQIRAQKIGVKVTYLKMSNWQDTYDVISKAHMIDARLVLFSAGPASKYMAISLSQGGVCKRVALDIGNSVDQWLLTSLAGGLL